MDGAEAAQARRAIFDMCVSDDLLVLGAHISFPGFARLERRGASYGLVADR
jgi:hypothetical protein